MKLTIEAERWRVADLARVASEIDYWLWEDVESEGCIFVADLIPYAADISPLYYERWTVDVGDWIYFVVLAGWVDDFKTSSFGRFMGEDNFVAKITYSVGGLRIVDKDSPRYPNRPTEKPLT